MNSVSKNYFSKTALPNEDIRSKAQWIADRLVCAGLEESKATRMAVATAIHWHGESSTDASQVTNTEYNPKRQRASRLDEGA